MFFIKKHNLYITNIYFNINKHFGLKNICSVLSHKKVEGKLALHLLTYMYTFIYIYICLKNNYIYIYIYIYLQKGIFLTKTYLSL